MRRLLLGCALLLAALPAAAADAPVLTVLTYDSFAAEWGPGPAIATAFERECDCKVKLVTGGDAAALLARLRLEGARGTTDVVLGLDTALMAEAAATGLFAPHQVPEAGLDLPVPWDDPLFLPYDWGWFAFVYDRRRTPVAPASFPELAASKLKIAIQDPRSSTPGLGLLLWVKAAYGDRAPEIWAGLADNILTVTRGWTESYNLFLDGEADMALSYTTSPAYHLVEEHDDTKAAALFDEGNYLQVELAAVTAASKQPDLARSFLRFLLTDPVQTQIALGNWMYPAVTPAAGLPPALAGLPRPAKTLLLSPDAAKAARGPALDEWRDALSR